MGIDETALHTNSFDYMLSTSCCFPAYLAPLRLPFAYELKSATIMQIHVREKIHYSMTQGRGKQTIN